MRSRWRCHQTPLDSAHTTVGTVANDSDCTSVKQHTCVSTSYTAAQCPIFQHARTILVARSYPFCERLRKIYTGRKHRVPDGSAPDTRQAYQSPNSQNQAAMTSRTDRMSASPSSAAGRSLHAPIRFYGTHCLSPGSRAAGQPVVTIRAGVMMRMSILLSRKCLNKLAWAA
jgi:hypothetical protein